MEHALLSEGSPSPQLPLHEVPNGEGDSSSGGSDAALASAPDPVSAQLINNITMLDYRSLGNTSPLILNEEELSKSECIVSSTSAPQLPHFVTWNWNLIRTILFWGVLSALLACLAAVIALVASLPRTCNPDLPWFQGNLFYEVFPASFQDSNGDGVGDIRGLISKMDYIQNLGVKAVRLNSIFKCEHYPERYKNVTSLVDIDKSIGNVQDITSLANALHRRNMSLILDLPIYPFITKLDIEVSESIIWNQTGDSTVQMSNTKNNISETDVHIHYREDKVAMAIRYWISNGVDGFYLKGMDAFVDDPNFSNCLTNWKKIIGTERLLMVNYETIQRAKPLTQNILMHKVDLVDVYLEVANGTEHVKNQVDQVMKGILWSKPGYPWVHWSVGSVETRRLSSVISPNHTLAAILLNMMLPGTPSIFYGDEVGLKEISDPEEDFHESEQIHNLVSMAWSPGNKAFTSGGVLAWAQGGGRSTMQNQERAIQELAGLRPLAPPIYVNAIWRDSIGIPNAQLRNTRGILVVERWYPRRNSYVLVLNMGTEDVKGDLSSWFYGGKAVVATSREKQGKELMFKTLSLQPAEAILIKLEK